MKPEELLEVCYAQNYGRSRRFAFVVTRDGNLAADFVQEAACRILRMPQETEIKNPWGYWCTTIARCAAQHFRDNRRRREIPISDWESAPELVDPRDIVAAREEIRRAVKAMNRLRPSELKAIRAHLSECPGPAGSKGQHADEMGNVNHRVLLSRARRQLVELVA